MMLRLAPLVFIACASSPPPAPTPAPAPSLVVATSPHSHADTLARAVAAIEGRGFTIVQRIDHAAAAQGVALTLDPTTVLVFGNPKAGTPLMQDVPTFALDLPLRMLVWQRADGVRVAYHAPAAVAAAHGAQDHAVVGKMTAVLAAIASAATAP